MKSGSAEGYPYSLSRWTDLPAAKWAWFQARLKHQHMAGVDPVTGSIDLWSLKPEDTLGLIFWTRNPDNLIRDEALLRPYQKVVHFTLTGWQEVEHKAPSLDQGLDLLQRVVKVFGPENVIWRFSPIPVLPYLEVLQRFFQISERAVDLGLDSVFLSFLQTNDLMPESRDPHERRDILEGLAERTPLRLILCNEDQETLTPRNHRIRRGVCEDGRRFSKKPSSEGCGCALSVDPFTINESCVYGCEFCYAADKSLAPKKRNTARSLVVLP